MDIKNKNNEYSLFENNGYEEEVDFGKIAKSPHRTFGVFYLLVVVGIIIGGVAFLDDISWIWLNKYDDTVVLPVYGQEPIAEKKAMVLGGVNVFEISEPTPELIATGKEVYSEYCTSCHGDNGKGDGAAGAALNPAPRNFHEAEGWTNGRKVSDIYKTLEEGILQNGMSAYDYLPVEDRFALAHYIRSLTPDAPEDSEQDLQNLDLSYQLSEGKETNNQISLEKAMRVIAEENSQRGMLASNAVSKVRAMMNGENGMLFTSSMGNIKIAVNTLYANDSWRSSRSAFENMIRADFGRNGISSGYNGLTSTQKDMLYSKLLQATSMQPMEMLVEEGNDQDPDATQDFYDEGPNQTNEVENSEM